jgi:hypothetical protein
MSGATLLGIPTELFDMIGEYLEAGDISDLSVAAPPSRQRS